MKNVNKDEIKKKIFYFYIQSEVKTEIQGYKCRKCGKKFKTNISEIVVDNSNFKHEFKNKSLELVSLFL
jgi:uncharacterized OB-fold protein